MTQSQMLRRAVEVLERLGIDYALVGALATTTLGESRFTNDIDIVVQIDVFDTVIICREFPEPEFFSYTPAAIVEVERGGQFNIVHPASSNKIDFIIVGESGWARRQLSRRLRREVLDAGLCYVAAPEDIILGKLLYYKEGGSEKHVRDITGILLRSASLIDRQYLDDSARELDVHEELQSVLQRLAERNA